MLNRLTRPLLVGLLLLAGTAVGTTMTASPASALCAVSPLQGDWHNINASTNAMTRLVVDTCQDIVTCNGGVCSIQHDAGTYMNPYGKCHPTDCNWGRRLATYASDGWIRATYNFGFKTSYVWARNYSYYGLTYLRVWVNNDFTPADGRADYITDEWFLR
jgi:hypothetical protein